MTSSQQRRINRSISLNKMDTHKLGRKGNYSKHQIQAVLMKKRAETDPSLPYLADFTSSSHDHEEIDSTFLLFGDLVSLCADNEDTSGFISTLGYVLTLAKGKLMIHS